MVFFIVCYVVIVKLDSADRVNQIHRDALTLQTPVANVLRMRENIIPPKIMEEFAQDHGKDKLNYDYYDDVVNTTEYQHELTTDVYIESENERAMKEHLENNELVIEDNWLQYFNKNSSESRELKTRKLGVDSIKKEAPITGVRDPGHDDTHHERIRNLPKHVHVFDMFKESAKQRNSINSNQCLLLKTMHGSSPICIHNPEVDEIISSEIAKTGSWEPNYLYVVGSILNLNKEMTFLDLGCNIGVYTILASQLRHKVIALDPNRVNLRLLTKALSLGGLKDKVTLLWNAIADVRGNVTLTDIIGNIGATFVSTDNSQDIDSEHKAFAITLDDLIPLFAGTPVFIKMDVETYELKALQGGENFFKEVDVQYILMEWIYHGHYDSGKDIITFMNKQGLYPHVNAHHNTKLEIENYRSWPGNVLWIKY